MDGKEDNQEKEMAKTGNKTSGGAVETGQKEKRLVRTAQRAEDTVEQEVQGYEVKALKARLTS